jgi:hypothetical protein
MAVDLRLFAFQGEMQESIAENSAKARKPKTEAAAMEETKVERVFRIRLYPAHRVSEIT